LAVLILREISLYAHFFLQKNVVVIQYQLATPTFIIEPIKMQAANLFCLLPAWELLILALLLLFGFT